MTLMRPRFFYPLCVFLGIVLGTVLITTGSVPSASAFVKPTPELRNQERHQAVNDLSSALSKYLRRYHKLPVPLPTKPTEICLTRGDGCTQQHLFDLSYLANGVFMDYLPSDPIGGRVLYGSGYWIYLDPVSGVIHIKADHAENGATIETTL